MVNVQDTRAERDTKKALREYFSHRAFVDEL